MAYTQQGLYTRVAKITGQELSRTRNQIRHWVNKGLIPASDKRGSGVGTRRSYDLLSVCVGAALVRLSSIGRSGEGLAADAEVMTHFIKRYLHEDDSRPSYFGGLREGAKGFILAEITSEPTVALLKDRQAEGPAAAASGLARRAARGVLLDRARPGARLLGARRALGIEPRAAGRRTGTHVYLQSQVRDVDFDVAVAAREEAGMKPGGGISIVVLKAGVEGEVRYENTAVNRIRFKVPIVLPSAELAEEIAQTDTLTPPGTSGSG